MTGLKIFGGILHCCALPALMLLCGCAGQTAGDAADITDMALGWPPPPTESAQRSPRNGVLKLKGSEYAASSERLASSPQQDMSVILIGGDNAPWVIYDVSWNASTPEPILQTAIAAFELSEKSPGDGTKLYFGLANYDSGRWEWIEADTGSWYNHYWDPASYTEEVPGYSRRHACVAAVLQGPGQVRLDSFVFIISDPQATIQPVETPLENAPGVNIRWTGSYPSAPSWTVLASYTLKDGIEPGIQIAYDLSCELDLQGDDGVSPSADDFDMDIFGTPRGGGGTYSDSFMFTAAEIQKYFWQNGDLTFLAIRAQNGMGAYYGLYSIPLWLGDVVLYEDFEPPFQQSHVESLGEPWAFDEHREAWVHCNGRDYASCDNANQVFIASPDSRPWLLKVDPRLGTQCVFIDNGAGRYSSGYSDTFWAPWQPPGLSGVRFAARCALSLNSAGELASGIVVSQPALGWAWGQSALFQTPAWGSWYYQHCKSEPLVFDGYGFCQQYGGIGVTDEETGNMRYGQRLKTLSGGPAGKLFDGGMLTDNWLLTHAPTCPPYL